MQCISRDQSTGRELSGSRPVISAEFRAACVSLSGDDDQRGDSAARAPREARQTEQRNRARRWDRIADVHGEVASTIEAEL